MFNASVYRLRRQQLKKILKEGIVIFPGNNESPINDPSHYYPFRQDSNFLYYFGISRPGLTGIIDISGNKEFLIGNDPPPESLIWQGKQPSVHQLAMQCGVKETLPPQEFLMQRNKILSSRKYHWLPVFRCDALKKLTLFTGKKEEEILSHPSEELIRAVVQMRSVKTKEEITAIEQMAKLYHGCLDNIIPYVQAGVSEQFIAGRMEGYLKSMGARHPFQTICSVRGEILHNPFYRNTLRKGDLLLIDGGAESEETHYGCDITRVFPVNGKFSPVQKEIYHIVLAAQQQAINMLRPGILFRDVHMAVCQFIAEGLKEMKLMKGHAADAVHEGAHVLFFPHGTGHMLGLDTHDMSSLGEKHVGYDKKTKRSSHPGLTHLRFARELQPGFVLTVGPGIYFVPEKIKQWKKEKKFTSFINYHALETFFTFGGIRIEDNIVISSSGAINLSQFIPKKTDEIERWMKKRRGAS